ncbi:MAG TPA: aminoglycoside phosphotransferase family protein [Patescibacteria group bacterium]
MNEDFKKKIIALLGRTGKEWFRALPEIIKKYELEWDIKTQDPFPLSYNYVCPAITSDNKNVVLKISFPENNEFITEIEALKTFDKEVVIRIIREDLVGGAVLLERALPGKRLREITPDNDQIHYASQVLRKLHRPVSESSATLFPSVADWAKAFDRYKSRYPDSSGPIPKNIFDLGEGIFREFLQDKKEQVVLHGDLHSDNILSSERGWLVIDPKGVIGEREFELGAYLRNPYYDFPEGSDLKALETNRIIQSSEELGFDKERVRGWALACAVISLVWFLEDEDYFKDEYVRNAELIRDLKI